MSDFKASGIMPDGIIAIKKQGGTEGRGFTSHDAVGRARRLFATRAVGHTGTLDPMAEGVLVLLIGRSTKCERFLVCDSKEYVAGLKLGVTTDTEDITGTVLSSSDSLPSAGRVKEAVLSFVGEYDQIPPMYSSVKVGGKKLYEYAREGREIERRSRRVTVHSADCECVSEESGDYIIRCSVSSGTYIRTLCADVGKALGVGGVMTSLTRTRSGAFSISDCVTLDELEAMDYSERLSLLTPPEKVLVGERLVLPDFYERLYLSGCEIYQKKIKTDLPTGSHVLVFSKGGKFLSYGTVKDFPDGSAIKSEVLFGV